MKAIVCNEYGPLESISIHEVPTPAPGPGEVQVRVMASSVNYNTVSHVTGKPFLVRMMGMGLSKPKYPIPGNDIAGRVTAAGKGVRKFTPGDEVFADVSECGWGAFAEYICVPEETLTLKPSNASFAEAAAVPEAGLVALQALRDAGGLKQGQQVLICGASGGIGTFALQITKAFGAEVTAVCSTRNRELVHSLGADHIIDYTKEDFLRTGTHYDLILATAGYRPLCDYRRALKRTGRYVCTGGEMKQIFQGMLFGPLYSRKKGPTLGSFLVKPNKDLPLMKEMMEKGTVKTVMNKSFHLEQADQALKHYAAGKAQGKLVITIEALSKISDF